MKTEAMAKIAVRGILVPMFAMLLAGGAVAGEETDDLVLAADTDGGELTAMDSDALAEASGGFIQIANTEQQTTVTDNTVSADNGAQINTGGILAASANSGGISTMMLNTGNNVSFQNSTNLNIYLDAAQ